MFAVIFTAQVRPESLDEFRAASTANATASVRDEPGCERFDVVDLADNWFSFYELYRTEQDFTVGHRGSPHFAVWKEVSERVLVPGTRTVRTGEVVAAG
jgi:autoinducer 2-degrading protein